MNKAFLAGLVIGAVLGYLWKQERVTSALVPSTGYTGSPQQAWDYYLASQGF